MQCIYSKQNLKIYLNARGEFQVHRDGTYCGVYFRTQAGAVRWCDLQLGLVVA